MLGAFLIKKANMKEQKPLSLNDLAPEYRNLARPQEYGKKPVIEGVQILEAKHFITEDGSFSEIVRLKENGELEIEGMPPFQLRQINYSEAIPGTTKAWHFHLKQDEIWYVEPRGRLIVGLLDLRNGSKNKGEVIRLILGGGRARLLYIPRGVAHGLANRSQETVGMVYLVNNQFDGTDEWLLPPETEVGEDFWEIQSG